MRTVITILILFLTSCCREDHGDLSLSRMYNCHTRLAWDETGIRNELIGKWEWSKTLGLLGPVDQIPTTVHFYANDSLIIVNDTMNRRSHWMFGKMEENLTLVINPTFRLLGGRIYMCENEVVFSSSDRDGHDHFFVKSE